MELLLNVIGHPGAGKSEACKHLEQQWGFEVYRPSSLIRSFANNNELSPKGREAFSQCHRLMIEEDPLAFVRPSFDTIVLDLLEDPKDRTAISHH
jgi:broad-specificity NMP kinase